MPVWISEINFNDIFEIDELRHYINYRPRTETRENIYVVPIISRTPRQIVSFGVETSKLAGTIQKIADKAPYSCTSNNKVSRNFGLSLGWVKS